MLNRLLRVLRSRADRPLAAHLRAARRGEDLAYQFLRRLGYVIVARNYRARAARGEIDLIGWDNDRLAFIEVKTRASEEFGAPGRAVDHAKRRHLVRTAEEFARRSGADPARMRFDVVSVVLGEKPPEVRIEKDVFSACSLRGRARRRFA